MSADIWAAWAAVAVALLAVITSSIFNMRTLRATREQTQLQLQIAREASQPLVWADVRGDQNGRFLRLLVGNSGPTVATNVTVKIDPPLPVKVDDPRTAVFQQQLHDGIASLPPGRVIEWFLFTSGDWDELMPNGGTTHHFTIDAQGPNGSLPTFSYDINLDDMSQSMTIPMGTLHDVAERLRQIELLLKNPNKPIPVMVTRGELTVTSTENDLPRKGRFIHRVRRHWGRR